MNYEFWIMNAVRRQTGDVRHDTTIHLKVLLTPWGQPRDQGQQALTSLSYIWETSAQTPAPYNPPKGDKERGIEALYVKVKPEILAYMQKVSCN